MEPFHLSRNNCHPISLGILPAFVLGLLVFPPFGMVLIFPDYIYAVVPLLIMFMGVVAIEKLLRVDLAVKITNILTPLLLFIFLAGISLIYANNPIQGGKELAKILLSVCLFQCLIEVCTNQTHLKILLKSIVWAGVVLSIHGIFFVFVVGVLGLQSLGQVGAIGADANSFDFRLHTYNFLGIPGFTSRPEDFVAVGTFQLPRCVSLFIEPGYFANFLELSIFSTLAYSQFSGVRRAWSVSIGLFLQCVAMLLTFSIGGWISILIGMLVWLIVIKKFHLINIFGVLFKQAALIILIIITANFIFSDTLFAMRQVVFEKVISDEQLTSGAMRLISIQLGIDSIFRHPVFGVGIGQMSNLEAPGFGADVKFGVNNALLSTQIELGLFGLILYSWILFLIISTLVKVSKKAIRTNHTIEIRIAAAISGCVVSLIIHSMFVETKWVPFYWMGISLLFILSNLFKYEPYKRSL